MADEFRLDASHDDLGLGGLQQWSAGLGLEAEFEPVEREPGTGFVHERDSGMTLDRFLLSGQAQGLNFRLGHHEPVSQGLLFDGESGWGLSADASLTPLDSDLRVFGVNADQDASETGFGFPDQSYYAGSVLESRVPLLGSSTRFSAGYVSGREASMDVADAEGLEASMTHGLGYSLGLSTELMDERLSLDLKTARSRFDHEHDRARRRSDDRAYSASLIYAPDLGWAVGDWGLGAEAVGVGADFYSPGHRELMTDRNKERLFLRLNPVRDWSLGYSYRRRGQGVDQHWLESHGSKVSADGAFRLSERLMLAPSGEFLREQYPERNATRYHSHLSLSANTWLISDTLSYRNTIELNRVRGTEDPLLGNNERHRHITGELEWQALAPVGHRPGLDLNVSFSADHRESPALRNDGLDGYQVLLTISSSAGSD